MVLWNENATYNCCACVMDLLPEDGLAALVLAVEVLGVLHLALLEPAALLRLEAEEIVLPDVLRNNLKQVNLRTGWSAPVPLVKWHLDSAIGLSNTE